MIDRLESAIANALSRPGGLRGALAVVLACACAMLFTRLGAAPVERNSELRCHAVAQGMVESGDWVVPRFEGTPRLQKPPLYYWLASASALAVGGEVTLGATRFPSALAALALGFVVFFWGRSTFGAARALLAVVVLVSTLQFSTSGRRGDAEMTLALWTAASLFAFDRWRANARPAALVAFTAALALAFLSKATVAFVTVLLPITLAEIAERRIARRAPAPSLASDPAAPAVPAPRSTFRDRRFLCAIAVAVVVGFAWYAVVIARLPHALDALLGDAVLPVGVKTGAASGAEHFMPPWYFFDKIWGVAAPISLLLPVVAWVWWKQRRTPSSPENRSRRLPVIAFCSMFVAFSILPQKQKHYLLPTLAPLSLVLADALHAFFAAAPVGFARVLRAFGAIVAVAGLGAAFVFEEFFAEFEPAAAVMRFVALPAGATLLLVALVAAFRVRVRAFVAAAFLASTALVTAYGAHVKVFDVELDAAIEDDREAPDEAHVIALAHERPWLVRALDLAKSARTLEKRRMKRAAPEAPR